MTPVAPVYTWAKVKGDRFQPLRAHPTAVIPFDFNEPDRRARLIRQLAANEDTPQTRAHMAEWDLREKKRKERLKEARATVKSDAATAIRDLLQAGQPTRDPMTGAEVPARPAGLDAFRDRLIGAGAAEARTNRQQARDNARNMRVQLAGLGQAVRDVGFDANVEAAGLRLLLGDEGRLNRAAIDALRQPLGGIGNRMAGIEQGQNNTIARIGAVDEAIREVPGLVQLAQTVRIDTLNTVVQRELGQLGLSAADRGGSVNREALQSLLGGRDEVTLGELRAAVRELSERPDASRPRRSFAQAAAGAAGGSGRR